MLIQTLSEPLDGSYHETSHGIVDLVFLAWCVLLASSREARNSYPSSRAQAMASSGEYKDKRKLKTFKTECKNAKGYFESIPI